MTEKNRYFGLLSPTRPEHGTLRHGAEEAPTAPAEAGFLARVATEVGGRRSALTPLRLRSGRRRLRLALDRDLARWRRGGGAAVFELLARLLARDKAGAALARLFGPGAPLPIVVLERSRHLVTVEAGGRLLGLNRAALSSAGLSARSVLVACALAHGLRAAARLRAREDYDAGKERARDVQNSLLMLVGVLGTEWDPTEVGQEFTGLLDRSDPFLDAFSEYASRLRQTLTRRQTTVLDDRVFRDGALFDRLPGEEKMRVIFAGTLAWYGVLTLGLLRLPRRLFARKNPYYETAWWLFRARPGARSILKTALMARAFKRLFRGRVLAAFELFWSSWNSTLAVTCLRPVYRAAGGNRRPFRATMATFAYTALVVHPLWATLAFTGGAALLGLVWPAVYTDTRIASRENLLLHGLVIGFWLGVGLLVATAKALRSLLSASAARR